jgi:hypothetical protein
MTHVLTSLLTGIWILLLLIGTGRDHRPGFLTEFNQEPGSLPSPPSFLWQPFSRYRLSTFTIPPEHVSIASLLSNGADYHQRLVAVRGLVTQPELHLDSSKLFVNFVFRLEEEEQSVVVFGRHDRTQGAPSIALDLSVEVIGVFWKERDLHGSHVTNTIEAITVTPYPSLIPENA